MRFVDDDHGELGAFVLLFAYIEGLTEVRKRYRPADVSECAAADMDAAGVLGTTGRITAMLSRS